MAIFDSIYIERCKDYLKDNEDHSVNYNNFSNSPIFTLDSCKDDKNIIEYAHILHNMILVSILSFDVEHYDESDCTWEYGEDRCDCGYNKGYHLDTYNVDWFKKKYLNEDCYEGYVVRNM